MSDYFEEIDAALRYAKGDAARLYPGRDATRQHRDYVLGDLLEAYDANRTPENEGAIYAHLHQHHPLAAHFLSYMERVGGPADKPYFEGTFPNPLWTDPNTGITEPVDNGWIQIYHNKLNTRRSNDTGKFVPSPLIVMHVEASTKTGNRNRFSVWVPNLHPEQLAPDRTKRQEAAFKEVRKIKNPGK